ncbi:Predicted RNA-binding protein, contains TRAM domain [Halogranum amylolyticum]|uniref:Predicted RNA-binding protein, contains TRAM domain n=1 Tax=Halogranum amylolyticum TaxID=660520 RepID=A0A1H8U8J3_9EURY|nr:TRAM domain-containing protein [Halogranum amylolyticum]SEO99602.1 Predicted RNA-binding protein, contains TRAM domain [Halogranum amylolyticum]
MQIPDDLLCLFSAQVDEQRGSYVLEVPKEEVTTGDVQVGDVHRVAIFATDTTDDTPSTHEAVQNRESLAPVEKGDQRTVDIEDIGDQGDGIARTDRGYVLIIPDTEQGERVTVEVTEVSESVGFADVIERKPYYE